MVTYGLHTAEEGRVKNGLAHVGCGLGHWEGWQGQKRGRSGGGEEDDELRVYDKLRIFEFGAKRPGLDHPRAWMVTNLAMS